MDSKKYFIKGIFFILVFFSIIAIPNFSQADYQTSLYFSGYIQDQAISADIDAGNWSAPTVYDWDNDGAKDLLVGRKGIDGVGYVSLYRNIGTDAYPVFNGYIDIQVCTDPCFAAG